MKNYLMLVLSLVLFAGVQAADSEPVTAFKNKTYDIIGGELRDTFLAELGDNLDDNTPEGCCRALSKVRDLAWECERRYWTKDSFDDAPKSMKCLLSKKAEEINEWMTWYREIGLGMIESEYQELVRATTNKKM